MQLLIEMINLACGHLTRSQLEELFWSQAKGPFFDALPQRHYGGTPLTYGETIQLMHARSGKCLVFHPKRLKEQGVFDAEP